MRAETYPLQVLLLAVSGWVHRHQADVIEYLVEENRVLKEQLKGRKLRLTDDQRRRLAAKAKVLGRKTLDRVTTIVTPDTLRYRPYWAITSWRNTRLRERLGVGPVSGPHGIAHPLVLMGVASYGRIFERSST